MVDVCRTVDVDSSVKKRTWTYDEFHAALTRHVDQVSKLLHARGIARVLSRTWKVHML